MRNEEGKLKGWKVDKLIQAEVAGPAGRSAGLIQKVREGIGNRVNVLLPHHLIREAGPFLVSPGCFGSYDFWDFTLVLGIGFLGFLPWPSPDMILSDYYNDIEPPHFHDFYRFGANTQTA